MDVRISIGDFARMTHLSVKALRHYHDVGVLVPAAVDDSSGYRYYAVEQLPTAQVVRRLRDLDMPLDQVRAVLDAPDLPTRNAAIVDHLRHMEEQLAITRETVTQLRSLLETPTRTLPVELRTIGATDALSICDDVSVEQFEEWWTTAFTDLRQAVASAGLAPTGPPAALYPAALFEEDRGLMTAFVPLATAPPTIGRAAPMEVPAVEAAVAVHHGAFGELDRTYASLGVEVAERGLIGVEGPIREYYPVSPFDTDDEAAYLTEVAWPVFRTSLED